MQQTLHFRNDEVWTVAGDEMTAAFGIHDAAAACSSCNCAESETTVLILQ
jgi:hypothetical protein